MSEHTESFLAVGGLNVTLLMVATGGACRVTVPQISSGHPSTR
ncbi:MAG: hypothetical protein ACRDRQ_09580 [Pseudonocardiaceae bacterium]